MRSERKAVEVAHVERQRYLFDKISQLEIEQKQLWAATCEVTNLEAPREIENHHSNHHMHPTTHHHSLHHTPPPTPLFTICMPTTTCLSMVPPAYYCLPAYRSTSGPHASR